jgi:hypothetical protein
MVQSDIQPQLQRKHSCAADEQGGPKAFMCPPLKRFGLLLFQLWTVFKLKRQSFLGPNLDKRSPFPSGSLNKQGQDGDRGHIQRHARKPRNQWDEDYHWHCHSILHWWLHASHGHGEENKGWGPQVAEECCCQPPNCAMFGSRIWRLSGTSVGKKYSSDKHLQFITCLHTHTKSPI